VLHIVSFVSIDKERDYDCRANLIVANSSAYITVRSISSYLSILPSGESSSMNAQHLWYNYVIFCVLYSIAHGTVDAVLAFATAELGTTVGSNGGFILYLMYTISALLFAKPALSYLGAKTTVVFGLVAYLFYVASFFLALFLGDRALGTNIFYLSAAVGGLGAGLLWTAQGAYFSINAYLYSTMSKQEESSVVSNFASLFAALYLLFETAFKAIATVIYLAKNKDSSWKVVVFGVYAIAALLSVLAFVLLVSPLTENEVPEAFRKRGHFNKLQQTDTGSDNGDDLPLNIYPGSGISDSTGEATRREAVILNIKKEIFAVTKALSQNRLLQLIIPYQLCFGLSAGFFGYYVNRSIVANNLGDGYIGQFSAIATFSAVLLAWPYAKISEITPVKGKWYVMVLGAIGFTSAGLPLLFYSDASLAKWQFLVPYFILHGAARGAWESTNKAVVAEYFPRESERNAVFASVYFTSGLAGAIGFYCYQYMTRSQMVLLNTIVPVVALVCYHYSYVFHRQAVDSQASMEKMGDVVLSVYSRQSSTDAHEEMML
jgi:MFS family permease